MRILAVDPGSKQVGLAVSDPTGTIATALSTLPATPAETLAERIATAAAEVSAERIIIGLPLRLDGSRGPEAAAAEPPAAGVRKAAGPPAQMVGSEEHTSELQSPDHLVCR